MCLVCSPPPLERRRWRSELGMRDEPPPAAFLEVAALERPERDVWSTRRQFADIVCGVEFTLDGRLLASAGVAKQVSFSPHTNGAGLEVAA